LEENDMSEKNYEEAMAFNNFQAQNNQNPISQHF